MMRIHRWMLRVPLVLLAALVAAGAAGCSDDDEDAPTPTATPPATPTAGATATAGPGGSATVEPSLQPVIDALVSRDWARIAPLLARRDEPCITEVRIDTEAPPCPAGAAAGTQVPVFPAASCHNFVYEHELEGLFVRRPEGYPAPQVYGIFRPGEKHPRVERLPVGTLGVVFSDGSLAFMVMVRDGKVVSADFGCGASASDMAALVPVDAWLMAPPR